MKKLLVLLLGILFLYSCGQSTGPLYRIGLDPLWTDLEIKGKEKNLVGFTTELLKEIAADQNLRIDLIMRNWDNLDDGLKKKNYEGMLSTIYPYIFYQKTYDFSQVFLETGPVLVMPVTTDVTSLDMLKGKEIGVGNLQDAAILSKHEGINARDYESVPQALNDVQSGKLDGALVESMMARAFCQDLYHGQLKIVTKPLDDEGLRLLTLHNENTGLVKDFNAGLKHLKANGKYLELLKKWSLDD